MTAHNNLSEKLFSYGTLQYEAVQLATFGRKLTGTPDKLLGYRLDKVKIEDPEVIKKSGEDIHNILIPTHNNEDHIAGMVFEITPEELAEADAYEVSAYKRVRAKLLSGNEAWAYVCADHLLEDMKNA